MRKLTAVFLYSLIAALVLSTSIWMLVDNSGKSTKSFEIYTDAPSDIVAATEGKISLKHHKIKVSSVYDASKPALVSQLTPEILNDYDTQVLAGYYSVAAFCRESDTSEMQVSKLSNKSGSYVYMVDLKKILEGFEEGKSWNDIGIDLPGAIKVNTMYDSKGDMYYTMVRDQIIVTLSEAEFNDKTIEEYNDRAIALIDKMERTTELKSGEVTILCNQSQYDYSIDSSSGTKHISFQPVICTPIYFCYNQADSNGYYDELVGYINDGVLADRLDARNPANTTFSKSNYKRYNVMDSVEIVISSYGTNLAQLKETAGM